LDGHVSARDRALELEVSEDVVMADVERTVDVLAGLRAIGVRLALDDFGAGHAALAHLSRLDVDALKVDRAFVMNCMDSERDAGSCKASSTSAGGSGPNVVAEGVDRAETWERLAAWGCHEAQGHFRGPPMSAHDLRRWLESRPCARRSRAAAARQAASAGGGRARSALRRPLAGFPRNLGRAVPC
jgi:EAL domain-containing protein (putative c-di-GMP-specific phosphodiesterase class I)